MPCDAGTQGPPDSLHPGEPAIAISMPRSSPSVIAYLKASFHSGVMQARAFLNHLRRGTRGVKVLEACNPHAMHPFQIELYTLLADVTVHPMPPHAWTGIGRRIFETPF